MEKGQGFCNNLSPPCDFFIIDLFTNLSDPFDPSGLGDAGTNLGHIALIDFEFSPGQLPSGALPTGPLTPDGVVLIDYASPGQAGVQADPPDFEWIGESPWQTNSNATASISPVPEPGTALLAGSGLTGLAVASRRRRGLRGRGRRAA